MELQKYMDVTVYGKCGHPCPTSPEGEKIDCRVYIAEHYYFLLVFENSYCEDYISKNLEHTPEKISFEKEPMVQTVTIGLFDF